MFNSREGVFCEAYAAGLVGFRQRQWRQSSYSVTAGMGEHAGQDFVRTLPALSF